nr:MAG TPA: hypothetical protein [Caudoviricetes sp.]
MLRFVWQWLGPVKHSNGFAQDSLALTRGGSG